MKSVRGAPADGFSGLRTTFVKIIRCTGNEAPVYAVGSNSLGDDLGVVYVGSSDKSFYAVTAETGKVKWRLDVDGAVATSAAIDADGRLYFATDTGVVYQVAENATERSGTESELV